MSSRYPEDDDRTHLASSGQDWQQYSQTSDSASRDHGPSFQVYGQSAGPDVPSPPGGYPGPHGPDSYGQQQYPAAPYAQQPWGPNPYAAGHVPAPPNHPSAATAMTFGLIAIITMWGCGVTGFLGIVGIVLGRKARREIDNEPGRWGGRGMATAGLVTGLIATVLSVLLIAVLLILEFSGAVDS